MRTFDGLRCKLFGLLAVSVLLSCSKSGDESVPAENLTETVTFSIAGAYPVKSEAGGVEVEYSNLAVMVFRVDGEPEAVASFEAAEKVTVEVRKGFEYRFYVVANAPEALLSSFESLTEGAFLTMGCTLEDYAKGGFVMFGSGMLATETMGKEPVVVELRRYCSKVFVGEIRVPYVVNLENPPHVTLGRIALINVVGEIPFSANPTSDGIWYNKMRIEGPLPGGVDNLLLRVYGGVNPKMEDKVPVFDATCALYAMPNPVAVSQIDTEWSPRCTRVAVELLVNGESSWYPVSLPAMKCNKVYVIDPLILVGPGSYSPDIPVGRDAVDFKVNMYDWKEADRYIDFMDE